MRQVFVDLLFAKCDNDQTLIAVFRHCVCFTFTMAALQSVDYIDMGCDGYERHLFVDQNAATLYQCGMYVMLFIVFCPC